MGNELRSKIKKTLIPFLMLLAVFMVIYSLYNLVTTSSHTRDYPSFIVCFVAGVFAIFVNCKCIICND